VIYPAGLLRNFYLTLNSLHALIKTNRLMLYKKVSTVVYETHVLYSVRTNRRVFNLRFDVPVAFSVADTFFSQSYTTYKTRCNRQHLHCVITR